VDSTTLNAKLVTESNALYHANTAVGRSMLWDYRNRKLLYKRKYIDKALPKKEPSKEMRLGSVVHALLLEPATFDQNFVRVPDDFVTESGALSTSKKAKEWAANMAKLGQTPYTGEEYTKAEIMVESLTNHVSKWLKFPRENERSIYWEDEISGLPCKCRPDWLMLAGDTAIVPDIKTSQNIDPHAFRSSVEEYGYHLQEAHYSAGIKAAYGVSEVVFMFAVVESNEPYEACIHRIDPERAQKANEQRIRLLCELRESLDKNTWQHDWQVGINWVSPRDFAME